MVKKSSSAKQRFCAQLADWLYASEWHFTTLLANCIKVIEPLPNTCDSLINSLLLSHPQRPSRNQLNQFLDSHPLICEWFLSSKTSLTINSINLSSENTDNLIDKALPQLAHAVDLATWLNISPTKLDWLADLRRFQPGLARQLRHYHYYTVDKRDGSKRLIEAPKVELKAIQRKIVDEILCHASVHQTAYGFVSHKSCQQHASLHTQKSYVFLFDLAHCFHSVTWPKIYGIFRGLGYGAELAKYLSALCSHSVATDESVIKSFAAEQRAQLKQRHLPQGAPSSPTLANAALYKLDKRLTGLAAKLKLDYSRYADDLAFSGNTHRDWTFFESLVAAICLEEGFGLNHHKSRLLRPHHKQKITGVVVNSKTNIDRRDYDQLKAILTNCLRHGIESQNRCGHPNFKESLYGRIQHLRSLNARKGKKLAALYEKL